MFLSLTLVADVSVVVVPSTGVARVVGAVPSCVRAAVVCSLA